MKSIVNYQGEKLYLELGTYPNGRLAILLNNENGELWDDLTVNLPHKELEDNYIFVNPNIQSDLLDKLCETGVFLNLYRTEDYDYRVIIVNKDMLNHYVTDYRIEMWETEEDRNHGYATTYDEHFYQFADALETARNLYSVNELASIMILNHKESVYCRDNDTFETFYTNNDKFSKIPPSILDEYIDNWMDHKELPVKDNKIYCEQKFGGFMAVDNSTNECYVEEFDTEEQAQSWLLGKEKEEIIEDEGATI